QNQDRELWKLGTLPPGLITFWRRTYPLDWKWHILGLGYNPSVNQRDIERAALIGKFRGWAMKSLSFAGRTQLLSSVISGTMNFWISTFILPKTCIKKIESLCSIFLWSGKIDGSKGAKVAWSTICLPKKEGGLGLRRFSQWNTTLCLRFIWLLFSDSGSLWALWHKYHNIKSNSLWEIKESPRDSWTWKAILRLRPVAAQFLKVVAGNGSSASFWFDTLSPFGPLINYIGADGPRQLRVPLKAKVKDACNSTGWTLPSPRSEAELNLHTHLTTIEIPSSSATKDEFCWVVDKVKCNGFSSSQYWNVLRRRKEETTWHDIVCFCAADIESRDHLFLNCAFSQAIWRRMVFVRLDPNRSLLLSWSELESWVRVSSQAAPTLLRKLTVQATIYHIWKQRNNIVHNQQAIPSLLDATGNRSST
ncbi:unnamed protein product, partial [Arabidopsis halleri]